LFNAEGNIEFGTYDFASLIRNPSRKRPDAVQADRP
jgi:hypothetical protein